MAVSDNEIRTRWFGDHVAEFHTYMPSGGLVENTSPIYQLNWGKRDGGGTYWTRYLIQGCRLVCFGDLGDAIYRWGTHVDWQFLANCSIDYFCSKCEASEEGRRYREWDGERARESVLDHFWEEKDQDYRDQAYYAETVRNARGKQEKMHQSPYDRFKLFREQWTNNAGGFDILDDKQDLDAWLMTGDPYDIFGDCWYEWLPGCGEVPALRCRAHLIGIKMAVEQLSMREILGDFNKYTACIMVRDKAGEVKPISICASSKDNDATLRKHVADCFPYLEYVAGMIRDWD